jgi:DNA repair ATPase RecN
MESSLICRHSDTYNMPTISKKEEQLQQQAMNGYWQNELCSLGIEPKEKKELNDNKEELENLSNNIKQAMFQDYKLAYSEEGDARKEEAESTVSVR